ncbi:MAG: hypothetical protein P8P83_05895, partial [Rickettsiaceae bacterium]|nr:hypothetical protein [Rickettsiaceae bacterium]
NSLSHRMMDTVIRDIDIVASKSTGPQDKHNLYRNGQKIEKAYYVASNSNGANHTGDGTESNPYSYEQLATKDQNGSIVIETTGARAMTHSDKVQSDQIQNLVGQGADVELTAGGHKVVIQDQGGVSANVDGGETTTLLDSAKNSAVKAQKMHAIVTAARLDAVLRDKIAKAASAAARAEAERAAAAAKLQRMARAKAEFTKKKEAAATAKEVAKKEVAAATKIQSLLEEKKVEK